jgi:hypothetical protein
MHIDIWVADIDSEAAQLQELEAKGLQKKPLDEHGFRKRPTSPNFPA